MAEILDRSDPLWWVQRLEKMLNDRRRDLQRYDDYFSGKHKLTFASPQWRRQFGELLRNLRDNWCELVVDAVEERLNIEGFRFKDQKADQDAWAIWQENQLDAESQIAHTEALINGEVSALVWRDEAKDRPVITIEHPQQMIVVHEAGTRRRIAALKVFTDDEGNKLATLYRSDGIYKFQRSGAKVTGYGRWQRRDVEKEEWPLANPLGVVPVVPLYNKPRLLRPGASELSKVIPLQDAVNKELADMLVASETGAMRQRWVTGLEIPRDPQTGKPIESFFDALDRLWLFNPPKGGRDNQNREVKVGEFEATDLQNFVTAIEMIVQHIASQTRTPPHYFYLRGEFPSGESIQSAEAGLVAKAIRKQRHFGEGWEEVMRLAFLVLEDEERGNQASAEAIWRDAATRTESEHVDAVLKMKGAGVPLEILWEKLGFTPQEIERMKTIRAQEALDIKSAFDPLAEPAPSNNGSEGVPADAGAS